MAGHGGVDPVRVISQALGLTDVPLSLPAAARGKTRRVTALYDDGRGIGTRPVATGAYFPGGLATSGADTAAVEPCISSQAI